MSLQIGDLARRFDIPVETIRYYEREGLLSSPKRSAGNYRQYSEAHAQQLAFILNCRSLDMTQQEIRTLLSVRTAPAGACSDVNELIDTHIVEVGQRIRALKRLLIELKTLRQSCSDLRTVQQCEILSTLSRSSRQRKSRQQTTRR